jgi:hypothetical protein
MKAAIFYRTDEHINCERTDIREQIENIIEEPDNFELKTFTDEDSMLKLINITLGKPVVGVSVSNICDTKDAIYAGYFIDVAETTDNPLIEPDNTTTKKNKVSYNIFGSQITAQQVTSNLIIVKKKLDYKVIDNKVQTTTTPTTITEYEMLNVLEGIFVKEGIVLYSGEKKPTVYKYILNPLEHLMLTDPNHATNYVYHEYEVYNRIMMIIADTRELNGKPNAMATLLAGKPVNGTVFVALYKKPQFNESPPYVSLTNDMLDKIYNIRSKSPSYTTGMTQGHEEYVNFEKLLELEVCKYKDKPANLPEEVTGESLNVGRNESDKNRDINNTHG